MIKINDKYAIDFDKCNIILCEIKKRGEKAKNPNEEYFSQIGFFGNFEHLLGKVLQYEILTEDKKNIQDLINAINDFKKEIKEKIIEIHPDKRPYKYEIEGLDNE